MSDMQLIGSLLPITQVGFTPQGLASREAPRAGHEGRAGRVGQAGHVGRVGRGAEVWVAHARRVEGRGRDQAVEGPCQEAAPVGPGRVEHLGAEHESWKR